MLSPTWKIERVSIAVVFLLMLIPQTLAAASSPAVACVQNQLNALGYDTGKPDGLLGRKTRLAMAEYEKQNGKLTRRRLDVDHAVIYCRQLGQRNSDLKAFWPSRQSQFEFIFGDSVSHKFRVDVSKALLKDFSTLKTEFGLEVPLTITVVVASSAEETMRLVSKHYTLELADFQKKASEICSTKNGFSAAAPPMMIVICRNGTMEVDQNIARWWFENTLAHELFHQIQYELAGWKNLAAGFNAVLESNGPVWMSEGTAEIIGVRTSDHWTEPAFRKYSWEFLGATAPNLALLEREDAFGRYRRQIYVGGRLSVYRLIDAHGLKSIISFYENLGLAGSWKVAFRRTFGLSVKEFYAQIRKMDHG